MTQIRFDDQMAPAVIRATSQHGVPMKRLDFRHRSLACGCVGLCDRQIETPDIAEQIWTTERTSLVWMNL